MINFNPHATLDYFCTSLILRMKYLLILGLLYFSSNCWAQEKIEREYRINLTQVPEEAKLFVSKFNPTKKTKWLKEESENGTSVEAKFKKNGVRYSVEFTAQGFLEDVEVVVDFSEVPKEIKEQIQYNLKNTFDYYKVEKTQEQYIDSSDRILQWLDTPKAERTLLPKYEIVVKTRNSGEKSKRYQYLFDEVGNELEKIKVAVRRDNILRF